MMQAEVELLQAGYEALNRGDLDAAFRLTHSDFEWKTDDRLLNAGTYRGREEITRFLVDQRKPFDEVLQVPEEFFQQGNQVVVFVKLRSRPKGSRSFTESHIAHVWTFRDGKAARAEAYAEREKALDAVGLTKVFDRRRSVNRDEMLRLFEAHREAEAARDVDAILATFVEDCFLETMALGLRAEGRDAVKAAYQAQYFVAFPDLDPDDQGMSFGDDVMVVWGFLRGTSKGEWLGVPPGGGSFSVPFANVVPFKDGLMAGEAVYFDLATLCEQAGLRTDEVRAAAKARG